MCVPVCPRRTKKKQMMMMIPMRKTKREDKLSSLFNSDADEQTEKIQKNPFRTNAKVVLSLLPSI